MAVSTIDSSSGSSSLNTTQIQHYSCPIGSGSTMSSSHSSDGPLAFSNMSLNRTVDLTSSNSSGTSSTLGSTPAPVASVPPSPRSPRPGKTRSSPRTRDRSRGGSPRSTSQSFGFGRGQITWEYSPGGSGRPRFPEPVPVASRRSGRGHGAGSRGGASHDNLSGELAHAAHDVARGLNDSLNRGLDDSLQRVRSLRRRMRSRLATTTTSPPRRAGPYTPSSPPDGPRGSNPSTVEDID